MTYAQRHEEFLTRRIEAQKLYIALIKAEVFKHNLLNALSVLHNLKGRLVLVTMMNGIELFLTKR